jgi:hypothetical protein
VPIFTKLIKKSISLNKFHIGDNPLLFDGCINKNTGKENVKCASQWLGHELLYLDISNTGLTIKAGLNVFRYLEKSEKIRIVNMSNNQFRKISTAIATKIIMNLATNGTSSLTKLYIHNIQMLQSEAKILLFQLASLPKDALVVHGHGLEGALELRESNSKLKDKSSEKLKCSDCKQYKLLNQFLKKEAIENLGADDFAALMAKSMRGRTRCFICHKKRKDALDRAMGRTIELIKYGISQPQVKCISSLFRMNQFVSPEVVKARNRILARNNAAMKAAAMAKFNS